MLPICLILPLAQIAASYEMNRYVTQICTHPHHSYLSGLRYIHTPEECVEPYSLVPHGFRILEAQPPEKLQDYWTARFAYTTDAGGKHQAVIFSSDHESSQILFLSGPTTPHLLAGLSIKPLGTGGFRLLVTGTRLQSPSPLELILTTIPRNAPTLCTNQTHNPNLTRYRLEALRRLE